jgi:hypothetical protein
VGWVRFDALRIEIHQVPSTGGVYVVVRGSRGLPQFLDANPGGRFKGRDPSVPVEALRANWVDGAEVVYIGKADQLRRRLRQFADFGAGHPIGHWGGRLIWQLAESDMLLVAWKRTPEELVPRVAEAELIARFRAAYGKPPFANDPHLIGR